MNDPFISRVRFVGGADRDVYQGDAAGSTSAAATEGRPVACGVLAEQA